jgi:hypothetical protein
VGDLVDHVTPDEGRPVPPAVAAGSTAFSAGTGRWPRSSAASGCRSRPGVPRAGRSGQRGSGR